MTQHVDVVIIGAGLAGLSLARQLQLRSPTIRILHLDRRAAVPPARQKVGEATVQVSGYYLSKVLDLEEHLLRCHFLKYNLRFYWKTPGRANDRFEDYCQSYIRGLSNIATYQLDRNVLEAELLRRNREAPSYQLSLGAADLDLVLSTGIGAHRVTGRSPDGAIDATADWVVDATGRGHLLARREALERDSPIRHGSSFIWVDGLLDIEKLTDSSPRAIRLNPSRAAIGHLPFWLATNHFCGEGFWLWVIPLHGKTSIGLVYDRTRVDGDAVNTPERLVDWVCRVFPLFARDLPSRRILHHGSFRSVAFDCRRTIDANRWALVGEAGRFTDPLYSPGGDLIAIYNTLVTDAILATPPGELARKAALYEQLMRAVYGAYVPSYAVSYDALGDQESMTLKYVWELTIYFGFYVFPFVNELFTDHRFALSFLNAFSRLGPVNAGVQRLVNGYYHWKKHASPPPPQVRFGDFYEVAALGVAERTFYEIGISTERAREVLSAQLDNALQLARLIAAHVHAVVLDEPGLVHDRAFVERLDLEHLTFDVEAMRGMRAAVPPSAEPYAWPWPVEGVVGWAPRQAAAAVRSGAGE